MDVSQGWRGRLGVSLVGGLAVAGSADAGPVRIISQERTLTVSAQGGAGRERITKTLSAENAGTFSANVSADDTNPAMVAKASAGVDSTLGDTGFRFRGRLAWYLDDLGERDQLESNAEAQYAFNVVFAVDETYRYSFANNGRLVHSEGGSGAGDAGEFLSGPGASGALEETGVLTPGTYTLELFLFQGSSETTVGYEGSYRREFDLSFDLAPVANVGQHDQPAAVPLPPAVWSGLLVLGAGAVKRWRKRGST
jgi:hypothetical protein